MRLVGTMKRKLTTVTIIMTACLMVFSVFAEYPLKDNSEIIGVWKMEAESPALDGVKRKLEAEWEFKQDGTFIGRSKDFRASGALTSKLNYAVEDGKIIKQLRPGSSKNEACTVIEKEGMKMILKCRTLYFFLTKQQ